MRFLGVVLCHGICKSMLIRIAKQHLSLHRLARNLNSLKLLNLSRNTLDDLPPGLFDGLNLKVIDLESLTTLDLRGNRLTDATLQDLARLKVELHVD